MVRAIRGAITVKENESSEIYAATAELLAEMINQNAVAREDLISIIFTLTPDLNACFPAKQARKIGYDNVPLMCMSEIGVEGALEKCIRILIHTNSDKTLDEIKHIYLKGASVLRPDLTKTKIWHLEGNF